MKCNKSSSEWKVHSTTGLLQGTNKEKSQISNLTLHLKKLEKGEEAKPKGRKY